MEDIEIIDANEARRLTKEAINKDNSVLKPIMEKIKKAINNKEYYCYISGTTSEYVIDKLHALGYQTQYLTNFDFNDPHSTPLYKVMWKTPL